MNTLTPDELFVLNHTTMFGSESYPVVKRGSRWFIDGLRGLGAFPDAFKTKKAASARFELFLSLLRDKKAGRV